MLVCDPQPESRTMRRGDVAVSTPTRPPKPAPPVLRRSVVKLGITERLARWCSARILLRTLAIWALAIVSAVAAVALVMGDLTTEGHVTGSPSRARARRLPRPVSRPIRSASSRTSSSSGLAAIASKTGVLCVRPPQPRGGAANRRRHQRDELLRDPRPEAGLGDGHATIIPLNVKSHDEIEPIVDLVARADADPDFAVR